MAALTFRPPRRQQRLGRTDARLHIRALGWKNHGTQIAGPLLVPWLWS